MNITDAPKKQPIPFGINGQRENLLPTTPAGDNTASYDLGFPPVTMILKSAGGLPPKGQDMNQVLFELSSIARWFSAGGGNQFDSAFSTAVSGYPIGAVLLASDSSGYWISTTNGNTNNPENTTSALTGWIPFAQSGVTAITGLASSNVTLTTLQAAKAVITLAGTLTANISISFPAWIKTWKVINNCTGAFSVTCKTISGTGVVIPTGMTAVINGDGTNIYQDSNVLGVPGRLLNIVTITSSGTYTPSIGVKNILVEAQGGGGGGGGSAATDASSRSVGGGGASGCYVSSYLTISSLSTPVSISIGSGGAGGVAGGASGGAGGVGGTTTFGSLISALGGFGAGGGSLQTATSFTLNGGGQYNAAAGGNLINGHGESGSQGFVANIMVSGGGGNSYFSGGGTPVSQTTSKAGDPGQYGSGGSGGISASSSAIGSAGGAGGIGLVRVWEYA